MCSPKGYISSAASALIKTGSGILHGISFAASAIAVVTIWDNTSAAGDAMGTWRCLADDTVNFFPPGGIPFSKGIYVQIVSGAGRYTVVFE